MLSDLTCNKHQRPALSPTPQGAPGGAEAQEEGAIGEGGPDALSTGGIAALRAV